MKMRRVICFLAACALAACGSGGGLVAEVTNETDLERSSETVEIAWGDLRRAGVTADNVVVTTEEGEQIPSQVIFDSAGEPVTLLFQATVAPAASTSYRIEAGEREAYEPQAYGRYVPERADAMRGRTTLSHTASTARHSPIRGRRVWTYGSSRRRAS